MVQRRRRHRIVETVVAFRRFRSPSAISGFCFAPAPSALHEGGAGGATKQCHSLNFLEHLARSYMGVATGFTGVDFS
jgi:hypothetical protein